MLVVIGNTQEAGISIQAKRLVSFSRQSFWREDSGSRDARRREEFY